MDPLLRVYPNMVILRPNEASGGYEAVNDIICRHSKGNAEIQLSLDRPAGLHGTLDKMGPGRYRLRTTVAPDFGGMEQEGLIRILTDLRTVPFVDVPYRIMNGKTDNDLRIE